MADAFTPVNGIIRKVAEIDEVASGIVRKVPKIPVPVSGIVREGYTSRFSIKITFSRSGYTIEKSNDLSVYKTTDSWGDQGSYIAFDDVTLQVNLPYALVNPANIKVTQHVTANYTRYSGAGLVSYMTIRDNYFNVNGGGANFLIGTGYGGADFPGNFERTDSGQGYSSANFDIQYHVRVQYLYLISGTVTIETTFEEVS